MEEALHVPSICNKHLMPCGHSEIRFVKMICIVVQLFCDRPNRRDHDQQATPGPEELIRSSQEAWRGIQVF